MFVANWKMNGSEEEVKKWIDGMSALTPSNIQSKCIFCPPVCFLSQASNFIKDKGLNISLGAVKTSFGPGDEEIFLGCIDIKSIDSFAES